MDENRFGFRLKRIIPMHNANLKWKKQDKKDYTVAICCNEDGSEITSFMDYWRNMLTMVASRWVPNPAQEALNVLDRNESVPISAWTMDVSANTIANCFRHCKLRSTDNMTFENSDEGGESTQELQNLIKELGYRKCNGCRRCSEYHRRKCCLQVLTVKKFIVKRYCVNY
ncbi:hypothetical protein Tco_0912479 [Tanacetum coccineum]